MAEPHVLVIDDDHLVLKLAALIFRRAAYAIRAFQAARDVADADVLWADLAIVDLRLEGASGVDVARKLREQNPRLRILGWSADDSTTLGTWDHTCDRCILKPFGVEDLRRVVAEMLGDLDESG